MKLVKILLRAVFILLALITFFACLSLGVPQAAVAAFGMLAFGFVVTHPLGLNPENYDGYDLDLYRVGFFTLAAAIFAGSVGPVLSKVILTKIFSVVAAVIVAYIGMSKINKSKSGRNAA